MATTLTTIVKRSAKFHPRFSTCRHRSSGSKDFVKIVEVGARDGLQNEKELVPTNTKIELIDRLSATGLQTIEATSFVSPKWVPQLADNKELFTRIEKKDGVSYPVLVPNLKGYQQAVASGVKEIAVFGSASEGFSQKNINCSIEESLKRFQNVFDASKNDGIRIRGYLSCTVGCPYDDRVAPKQVAKVTESLLEMGCYEVSLADTIGVGNPESIERMLGEVLAVCRPEVLAIHCHDTNGKAVQNIAKSLDLGVRVVDSSVGGLGGCPYAKNATGNVSTEKVLQFLSTQGVETGVNLEEIKEIGEWIRKSLGK
ncbi:hydroxymethylglutaryl-CoA lyase, mitochondrial-like [Clytia hemisphaerica]|uniref:hydroxymethylglutaryl-CoA lyase n=1 Tax=Clytia hemisphaerica TaxID=252671 RepID=A0A7M5VCX7_9CNID